MDSDDELGNDQIKPSTKDTLGSEKGMNSLKGNQVPQHTNFAGQTGYNTGGPALNNSPFPPAGNLQNNGGTFPQHLSSQRFVPGQYNQPPSIGGGIMNPQNGNQNKIPQNLPQFQPVPAFTNQSNPQGFNNLNPQGANIPGSFGAGEKPKINSIEPQSKPQNFSEVPAGFSGQGGQRAPPGIPVQSAPNVPIINSNKNFNPSLPNQFKPDPPSNSSSFSNRNPPGPPNPGPFPNPLPSSSTFNKPGNSFNQSNVKPPEIPSPVIQQNPVKVNEQISPKSSQKAGGIGSGYLPMKSSGIIGQGPPGVQGNQMFKEQDPKKLQDLEKPATGSFPQMNFGPLGGNSQVKPNSGGPNIQTGPIGYQSGPPGNMSNPPVQSNSPLVNLNSPGLPSGPGNMNKSPLVPALNPNSSGPIQSNPPPTYQSIFPGAKKEQNSPIQPVVEKPAEKVIPQNLPNLGGPKGPLGLPSGPPPSNHPNLSVFPGQAVNKPSLPVEISSKPMNPVPPMIGKMMSGSAIIQDGKKPQALGLSIPKNEIPSTFRKFTQGDIIINLQKIIDNLKKILSVNDINAKQQEFEEKLKDLGRRGSDQAENVLNHLKLISKCKICNENNPDVLFELRCSDIICLNCLKQAAFNTQGINDMQCPACGAFTDKAEEASIWRKLCLRKNDLETYNLRAVFEANGELKCTSCQNKKKRFYDVCLHYCKECFADKLRSEVNPCLPCTENFDLNQILNETFECDNCGNISYFIGSYGKYIDKENYSFCVSCTYEFYNLRRNERFNIQLSKQEKVEVNDHLFDMCAECKTEVFKGYMKVLECGHRVCENHSMLMNCRVCSAS